MNFITKGIKNNYWFWILIAIIWILIYLNNNYYLNLLCPKDWDCKEKKQFPIEKQKNKKV